MAFLAVKIDFVAKRIDRFDRELWVIDLGLLKVTSGGSAGGHNGVDSLIRHLGSGFVRYRLGIGPKRPAEMDLADFVLARFPPDQFVVVSEKTESFVQGLELLLTRGLETAMNQLNRREPNP